MYRRYTWRTGVLEAVMICVTAIFAIPLYLLLNIALRSSNDAAAPFALPTKFVFSNFAKAWQEGHLGNGLTNSAIVTVVSIAAVIILASMASYPLARITKTWSKAVYYIFMIGLLLPFQLAMIPLYVTMRNLGLLGTVWSLVLYYIGLQMPFSIFLYVGFIRALPIDYEEAASLDGASMQRVFWSIVFPLLRPITGTVIILNVLTIWNDFLTPLLYLSGGGQQTITVSLYGFVGQFVAQWNLVFAGLVISVAPILLAYFVLQRTVIRGFASGLKG